jgi:hypothetical protein
MTTPTDTEIKMLVDWLDRNPGWIKSGVIEEWLGFDKRTIRAIAEHSKGKILSWPGSPGYCHINHAKIDEISHAQAALIIQSGKMIDRAREIEYASRKLRK